MSRSRETALARRAPLAGLAGVSAGLLFGLFLALSPLLVQASFMCPFKALSGLPGPFCGLTHSLAALAQGRAGWALFNYPLLLVLAGGALLALLVGLAQMLGLRISWPGPSNPMLKHWPLALAGLIAANWAYRLALLS